MAWKLLPRNAVNTGGIIRAKDFNQFIAENPFQRPGRTTPISQAQAEGPVTIRIRAVQGESVGRLAKAIGALGGATTGAAESLTKLRRRLRAKQPRPLMLPINQTLLMCPWQRKPLMLTLDRRYK